VEEEGKGKGKGKGGNRGEMDHFVLFDSFLGVVNMGIARDTNSVWVKF
jgi:hypothetical protein